MLVKISTIRLNAIEGCIIVENAAGELIASSGCEEGIPTLSTQFCNAWIANPLPEVEIWEGDIADISNAYTEEFGYLFPQEELFEEETFEEWLVGNGLEINLPKSDLEELEDQWNLMNHLYEIVCGESEDEEDEPNAPTYPQYQACENQLYGMVDKLKEEIASQSIVKELGITHKLVKRKNPQPRVDFQMLVNSSSQIWNAGHLLGLGQDPNNEVIKEGQESVKNLELFFKNMANPKFATKASFEIAKYYDKN